MDPGEGGINTSTTNVLSLSLDPNPQHKSMRTCTSNLVSAGLTDTAMPSHAVEASPLDKGTVHHIGSNSRHFGRPALAGGVRIGLGCQTMYNH